jgi:hypothetical protein
MDLERKQLMETKGIFNTFRTPALIFLLGLAILFLISLAANGFLIDGKLTGILEAVSATVGTAAVFAAAYFAFQELEEVSKSRHIDVADRLFDELNSPEIVEARRIIYQSLDDDPETGLKNLSDENRDAMKDVLNSLDRVAFLTQPGWIPDELVMPWMHPMISKSWEKLEPYVLYERERRNEPYYYKHAGELAERCRKWRARHLAETTTKWVGDAL